jgi:O-antigen/teichoic acid export membrane protein
MGSSMPPDETSLTLGSIRRRLLTGSVWVLGARVLGLGLAIVMNGLLARLLDPTGFGAFLLTSTMVVIGSTVAKVGMDRTVVRFAAESLAVGDLGRARHSIRMAVAWAAMASAAVAAILALGVGQWFFGSVLGQPLVASVVPIAAGWLFATAMQSVFAESFRGLSRFGHAAVFHTFATDLVTVAVLGAVFITSRSLSLSAAVGLVTSVAAVVLAVTGVVLARTVRTLRGPGRVDRWEMLRVARPLLVTNLGIYLLGHGVDLWILGAFQPAEEVSLYGAAAKLVVFVATPMIIFSGVIPPLVAELFAQKRTRRLERTLRVGATIVGLPALFVLLIFVVAAPVVLEIVYGPFYRQAAPILLVLSLARVVAVWTGSCGIALMMTGHQRDMMHTTALSAIVSVGGGLLVAGRYGAMGVAIATSTAQVLQNVAQLLLARRRLGIWTYVSFSPSQVWEFFRPRRGGGGAQAEPVDQDG